MENSKEKISNALTEFLAISRIVLNWILRTALQIFHIVKKCLSSFWNSRGVQALFKKILVGTKTFFNKSEKSASSYQVHSTATQYLKNSSEPFFSRWKNFFLYALSDFMDRLEEQFQSANLLKIVVFGFFFLLTWVVGYFLTLTVSKPDLLSSTTTKVSAETTLPTTENTSREALSQTSGAISRSPLADYYSIESELDLRQNTDLIIVPERNTTPEKVKEEVFQQIDDLNLMLDEDKVIQKHLFQLNQ